MPDKTNDLTPAEGQQAPVVEKSTAVKLAAFTSALELVLNQPHSKVGVAIALTDQDLIEEVNEHLPPKDRVAIDRLVDWKQRGVGDDELGQRFKRLYGKALRRQKMALMENLASDVPGAWQKWSWILERKFDEWNLRNKVVDETPAPKQLVFRVHDGKS